SDLFLFKSSALARADFNVLATKRADLRGTTASTACACKAFRPWIWRTTSRIFCADMRTPRVIARTSINLFCLGFRRVRAVFLENARRGKLAQPVAHHVLRHEDRVEYFAVMHVEGQPDKIRCDHRTARPGLDRGLRFRFFRRLDLVHQMMVNERTFLNRASHRIRWSVGVVEWWSVGAMRRQADYYNTPPPQYSKTPILRWL